MMKTLFLADGEKHIRDALRLLMENRTAFEISGEANNAESLLARVCQHPPDIILLDWNLPGFHPQRLLNALRQCCPETIVLAVSVRPEQERAANKFGVDAFILKQLPPDQFIAEMIAAVNQKDESR
jgi:DNA-binding NarL/FixJ family response regulator